MTNKRLETVEKILESLSDERLEKLLWVDWLESWIENGKRRYNARKRFVYWLKKLEITEEEFGAYVRGWR